MRGVARTTASRIKPVQHMAPTSEAELSRSFMAMLHSKDEQIRKMGDRLSLCAARDARHSRTCDRMPAHNQPCLHSSLAGCSSKSRGSNRERVRSCARC